MEDTTKFLKVWHENQGLGERNERQEKNSSSLNRRSSWQTQHPNSYTISLRIG